MKATITIINKLGVETLIFAKTFESEAFDQVKTLANYEAYQDAKIRIMPDAHAGKGCTVGTTMTITDRLTPNLVGVDIGCGILTVKLNDTEIDLPKLDDIIKTKVPSGFHVHQKPIANFDFCQLRCAAKVDVQRALHSIGSLGGGNHFIELAKSDKGELYLIIHSGSRKLGADVCKHYQDKALAHAMDKAFDEDALIAQLKAEGREREISAQVKKLKKNKRNKALPNKDLAYLTGNDFKDYMNDMAIAQSFASLNRETMAAIVINEMGLSEAERFETVHNYIDFKRMILRKGAVSAEKGEILLIPINMRDGSLICIGKGNEDWNYSAPHGAGRLMSRTKAKENIDMADFVDAMKGVYSTSVTKETLDEAPQAYKSLDEIKETITDTVDIVKKLRPVYNFKAH